MTEQLQLTYHSNLQPLQCDSGYCPHTIYGKEQYIGLFCSKNTNEKKLVPFTHICDKGGFIDITTSKIYWFTYPAF
jgi:hypothetical protein